MQRSHLLAGAIVAASMTAGAYVALSAETPTPVAKSAVAQVPDFSGNWRGGNFQPPVSGHPGVRQDPRFKQRGTHLPNGQRQAPVPAVGDPTDPLLTPWAAAELKKISDRRAKGELILPARSLCWPNGVPGVIGFGGAPRFVQTMDQVMIYYEEGPEMRRIYLNVPHSQNLRPSWYGESVGHYEVDTLVVDTIGLNDKTAVDDYLTPHTQAMHVVERYHLVDDGKTLEVQFTVDDPGAFNEPWSGLVRYRRAAPDAKFVEIRCAENNFDVTTGKEYPLPRATNIDF